MPGRHRRPSPPSGAALRLARTGALAVLSTAPLAAVGTAHAAPASGVPTRFDHHLTDRWDDEEDIDAERDDGDDGEDADDDSDDGTAHASPASSHSGRSSRSSGAGTSDARWDRIAKCESGNDWGADTGNGYRGGLQFTDSTWRGYGGRQYAPSADQASREEQIAVAKKVQKEQGWQAWPSCSRQAGYR